MSTSGTPIAPKETLSNVNVTAALDVEGNFPLESVQIDGLVVLKIIKHCREFFPSPVTGQLLGLDVNGVLEVTNSFPIPGAKAEDENELVDGARYQVDMMRCLREVNVDNNTVGWYQSTYLGSFVTHKLIETQYNYQQTFNNKSVVIVHDVSRSTHSNLSLRAFRFSQAFMEAQKEDKFTTESLIKNKLTFSNIFEELPITVKNSHLVTALLHSLDDYEHVIPKSASLDKEKVVSPLSPNFDTLELSLDPYIEKNLEFLLESVEEHTQEQNTYAFWQRSVSREQTKIQVALQKRKQENVSRIASGLEPLPEDDIHKNHKLPAEPSRLDSLLITSQINNYCKQLNQYSGPTLGKLFIAGELQK
ncbi:17085_t:CDS:2 [Funneliformis geosporum]|uniref:Eukaryotic translation initiation factor 3 subunit H n=1 Tax=Funneliformis geosporum TaxID=1117311 RepID=A0A9W4WM58_9GLOM|nr:18906_t:CDS:2 [Funneliformis geosporum]CAI2180130.1 17085_t:CDS:2 [Funneliformis geosporum]